MSTAPDSRRFDSPHLPAPAVQLLSNGRYAVMLDTAGSGYSRWGDLAVTRWIPDATCDAAGYFIYLRDVANGRVWSAGYQPVGCEPAHYEVSFEAGHARITRRDGPITTSMEVFVSSEDDVEVRSISLANEDSWVHEIEVTSYAELVLASAAADAGHPAFSKLFVQTEFLAECGCLIAARRRREAAEPAAFAFHSSAVEGCPSGTLQFETNRARFLGRGLDARTALSIMDPRTLSNSTGTVLDPVLSIRRRLRVEPGGTARVAFWLGAAGTREAVVALSERHADFGALSGMRDAADTHAARSRDRLGIDADEARLLQSIAGKLLYGGVASPARSEAVRRNRGGPAALWACGLSGDRPIVRKRVAAATPLEDLRRLMRAQAYWLDRGCAVDLALLVEGSAERVEAVRRALDPPDPPDRPASASPIVLSAAALAADSRSVLEAAARLTIDGAETLLRHAEVTAVSRGTGPRPSLAAREGGSQSTPAATLPALEFFNGLGGFAAEGREYLIVLDAGQRTPAPWVNVLANPEFGCLVSADGIGATWAINARENQLTPWSNDPVSNAPAEVVYLRDDVSGDLWSATPLPLLDPGASFTVRHGFGYTCFEHVSHGIELELEVFVPLEDPVKVGRLTLINRSAEPRQLSVTLYVEWVLGNQRGRTAPFIVTELEPNSGALLARNAWSQGFASRVAFLHLLGGSGPLGATGDRAAFLGRHGSLAEPAALLERAPLAGRTGAGFDPCGALQCRVRLAPGERTELTLLLGQGDSEEATLALIERYRALDLEASLARVTAFWERTLDCVQVKTPDRSLDVLANGWLLYQTLASRLWGRTGFYQASGAWGFRDQLQDSMALCVAQPAIAREHILRAAARQFTAGDVQHWWLPGAGQGVRTRVSDDRIWLPFVVAHYLETTADEPLLDEDIAFLDAPPLKPGEIDAFFVPRESTERGSLYEHCVRALDSSLAIGSHGLPLFGTGDWNDGMNRVGAEGRGESVWLGWFLHSTLTRFAPVAERRGDGERAARWRRHAFALEQAIEREAWDGDWYRRGYYDDGTALGSVSSEECRIDSIAQSWGVISGAADPERASRAMAAVSAQLVSEGDGLVHLFTPPFDRTARDPGYVKAYPPGIRENGGQYTHAALWSALAFALKGDGDRAHALFSLLNPINHSSTRAAIHRYHVEPYVVCADVYSAPSQVGRGGWTWYTGSAGWMYRTALEGILGVQRRGRALRIDPSIPRTWPRFEVTYRHGASRYHVAVENPHGVSRGIVRATLDEREIAGRPCDIDLVDDGSYHFVRVTLG